MAFQAVTGRALRNFRVRFQRIGILLLLPAPVIFGQTLRLSSASASPGARISIDISLHSLPGKQPSTLQWEITIPSDRLSFAEDSVSVGPMAQKSGKTVNCAAKGAKTATERTLVCILYGGVDPIPDGVVAQIHFQVPANGTPGSVTVRLDEGLAVFVDLKKIALGPAKTSIRIFAK